MELVKITCRKIKDSRKIPHFNGLHSRAILCFAKYGKLNLCEATLLMDENKKQVQKILNDLIQLKIIEYKKPYYEMKNVFNALNTLINKAK